MKVLFFALAANVAAASACAAFVRASGHKARAVDATLLTKADREAVDLVFTHEDAADIVHAAYDDKPVIVVTAFNPADYLPERLQDTEARARGEVDRPPLDERADKGPAGGNADANGDGKVTAAELKAALTAKGIAFKGNASKADLQALLDASNTQA